MRRDCPAPAGDEQAGLSEPARTLEALVMASGRGETAAFMSLYDRVAPCIYGLALRILRDDRRAESVTVEVFADLWRTSVGFDPRRGSARAWMTAVAESHIRAELTGMGGGGRRCRRSRPEGDDSEPGPSET